MDDLPGLGITVDCTEPQVLARFWCRALGYVEAPPPEGWADWPAFLLAQGVPEEEWDDGATIRPAVGDGPSISFLRVPEPKAVKNRVHLDVKVSGGRHLDQAVRESRIRGTQADLVAHGGRFERDVADEGWLDHVLMQDPEGNEFCIV